MAHILLTGFCAFPGPNRVGVQLRHVIDGLVREHEVDVLVCRVGDQPHGDRLAGARILRVPLPQDPSDHIEAFQRALRRQLATVEYDVVQFRDGWSGVTALEMKRNHKYVTVFDVTRSPMAEPILSDLATATELERAQQSCIRRADLILVPSEEARQYVAGVTEESKVHVVPPGVNVDRFDWEHTIPKGRPAILYLGALNAGRGIQVLLDAMEHVALQSDAVLLLAGRAADGFSEKLSDVIAEMKLGDCVRVLGEIPNRRAASVIAQATVCVVPAATELGATPTALYPTKLLEYMACKRAIVAPRSATVEILIQDKKQALLFQPGDAKDLAGKLIKIIENPALREELAQHGYEKVRKGFSASGTRRKLLKAYVGLSKSDPKLAGLAGGMGAKLVSGNWAALAALGKPVLFSGRSQDALDDTNPVEAMGPGVTEGGEVTRVEMNPLLSQNKTQEPKPLVDAAGTIRLPERTNLWSTNRGEDEIEVLDSIELSDEDPKTGEIETPLWQEISDSSLAMIEDDPGDFDDDTDTSKKRVVTTVALLTPPPIPSTSMPTPPIPTPPPSQRRHLIDPSGRKTSK